MNLEAGTVDAVADDDPSQTSPAENAEVGDDDWEDAVAAQQDDRHTALPPKLESWRRRSAAGAILTGFAFGLQEALETKRDEPSIMMETSGAPPKDLPVEAELEQRPARHSVVKIRPWLLEGNLPASEDPAAEEQNGNGPDVSGPAGH